MKKGNFKLRLGKETLRSLQEQKLAVIAGATAGDGVVSCHCSVGVNCSQNTCTTIDC